MHDKPCPASADETLSNKQESFQPAGCGASITRRKARKAKGIEPAHVVCAAAEFAQASASCATRIAKIRFTVFPLASLYVWGI